MSKSRKIFWSIISVLAFILLLPLFILIGVLITTVIYIQVIEDFLNEEFENDEKDTGEDPEDY